MVDFCMKYYCISYMLIKAVARLDEQIDRVKTEINTVGPMRPGSLSVLRRRDRDNNLNPA